MKLFRTIAISAAACLSLAARTQQRPLYIVNGRQVEQIRDIPPEDILSTELLPADEQTVELYGPQANNGVVIVSLRYDKPAQFGDGSESFAQYIARNIKWPETERTARFVTRFRVLADGTAVLGEELESSDARLRRKALKAFAAAPAWQPATKEGQPVECSLVLRIQLPEGRPMPVEPAIIIR